VLKLVKKTFPPDRAIFIVTFLDFCFRLCSAITWLHKRSLSADEHARPGDQVGDLLLGLATQRAPKPARLRSPPEKR
jgi:hypothetical protein